MKQIIALLISISILITGCVPLQFQEQFLPQGDEVTESASEEAPESEENAVPMVWKDDIPEYDALDDDGLLEHVEDLVYREAVQALDSENYFVENVNAVYLSKEYLEELAYNSQANIYFGYTLDELDEMFQGTRYIFTLDENGQTTVQELQEIEDDFTETILKNVVIGTGVILVCVTVSVVSGGAGMPVVSMIFAVSAKTGAVQALSSGGMGAVSAGVVRGMETGDFHEALEAAALAGSDEFKWGAFSGVLSDGVGKVFALTGAARNGLTVNEAALIQKESGFPLDVIKQLHSVDEYSVYKEAGLKPAMINGRLALVQDIDLGVKSRLSDGTWVTNLQRMNNGLAPINPATGTSYELHHINQNPEGTLAVLTQEQHRKNAKSLNRIWDDSMVDHGAEWNKMKREFWMAVGKIFS